MTFLMQNFAYCALTADVDDTATTFSVDETSRLPSSDDLAAGAFLMTVESTFADDAFEVVRVTAKSTTSGPGDLTVQRAADGPTPAAAHTSGTYLKAAITATIMTDIYNLIQSAWFIQQFVGEWSAQAYPGGSIVRFQGGLYGTLNDTSALGLDPTVPSDYQFSGGSVALAANGAGVTTSPSSEDRIAQGFQLAGDTLIYGVLMECRPGTIGAFVGQTVTVGIASSLGGGTPTYVASKDWTVNSFDASRGSLNVNFDTPVTLTASTQYYVVVMGDAGDTTIVGTLMYAASTDMLKFGGTGVIADSTYDSFTDATFSTNLTGDRFWCFLLDSVVNDWTEILPPPGIVVYDTTMPTPDASLRGQLGILQQSGIEDILQVCLRNSDGSSYGWFEIVRGDAIVDLGGSSAGVATASGALGSPGPIGGVDMGDNTTSLGVPWAIAFQVSAPATVTGMSVVNHAGAGTPTSSGLQIAVGQDLGGANTLLGSATTTSTTGIGATATVTFSSPVALTTGVWYFAAIVSGNTADVEGVDNPAPTGIVSTLGHNFSGSGFTTDRGTGSWTLEFELIGF